MDVLGRTRLGLGVFTAGIFAWIFPNLALGETANAVTDVVIVGFGVAAIVGLGRAVDGVGTAMLRTGLIGVALCQFAQNLISAIGGLDAVSAAPTLVIMAASLAIIAGAILWRSDGWDRTALPWLVGGFVAFGFEPLYYLTLTLVTGGGFSGYLPGILLVAAGSLLAAWGFWGGRSEPEFQD